MGDGGLGVSDLVVDVPVRVVSQLKSRINVF